MVIWDHLKKKRIWSLSWIKNVAFFKFDCKIKSRTCSRTKNDCICVQIWTQFVTCSTRCESAFYLMTQLVEIKGQWCDSVSFIRSVLFFFFLCTNINKYKILRDSSVLLFIFSMIFLFVVDLCSSELRLSLHKFSISIFILFIYS